MDDNFRIVAQAVVDKWDLQASSSIYSQTQLTVTINALRVELNKPEPVCICIPLGNGQTIFYTPGCPVHEKVLVYCESSLTKPEPKGEGFCQECSGQNVVWFAPNEIWNKVIPNRVGMLCPVCFIHRAEAAGIKTTAWKVAPEERWPENIAAPVTLFQTGRFKLHSGFISKFKIECDALCDSDWSTIALMISERTQFSSVSGVPSGGLKLAKALQKYCSPSGPHLVVDDILTTGGSILDEMREFEAAIGFVVFTRGPLPNGVRSLFATETAAPATDAGRELNAFDVPKELFDLRMKYDALLVVAKELVDFVNSIPSATLPANGPRDKWRVLDKFAALEK